MAKKNKYSRELTERVNLIRESIPDWNEEKEIEYIRDIVDDNFSEVDLDVEEFIKNVGADDVISELDIDDIIRCKGRSKILDNFDVSDITFHYDMNDILDEYDDDEIANYLANQNYDFTDFVDEEKVFGKLFDTQMLVSFCKRQKPRGVLDKERMKEIINDYIDNWIPNKCF